MANVTITLTVDTDAILADPKDPNLPVNCRLAQAGGEADGNYMVVDLSNTEENVSFLNLGDVITWQGIPANGNVAFQINIESIDKDPGSGSVLSTPPVNGTWTYGDTVTRSVTTSSTVGEKETYTINFNIYDGKDFVPFSLDPKIQVHQP